MVLAKEEGEVIAQALGNKKAALLQNHGLLTVGKTIEEATYWFLSLEKCCQVQLLADAAAAVHGAATLKMNKADAAFRHRTVGSAKAGWLSAKPPFDKVHYDTGADYCCN